ncbi:hypothetical protein J6590_057654 [Homalodisca vitripennis]|nr:hypothetical protein J6590_057654 [Homalodisca vitripennis]
MENYEITDVNDKGGLPIISSDPWINSAVYYICGLVCAFILLNLFLYLIGHVVTFFLSRFRKSYVPEFNYDDEEFELIDEYQPRPRRDRAPGLH